MKIIIIITISALALFGCQNKKLPPDPGAAGKLTIKGIDSDSDGVRDDIQIAINNRYSNNESKIEALSQSAIATQKSLLAGESSDQDAIFNAAKDVGDSIDCLDETFGNFDISDELAFIQKVTINTSSRSDAYIKFNSVLSGSFFGVSNSVNPCETNKRASL